MRTRSRRRRTRSRPAIAERFRNEDLSADDVVEFRELTALADELRELAGGAGTIVMRPARLSAYLHALAMFVESRDEADWIRDEDREPLAVAPRPPVAARGSLRRGAPGGAHGPRCPARLTGGAAYG